MNPIVRHSLSALLSLVSLVILTVSADAAAPVHLDAKGERWAAATLRKMSLEEKVGQMIMPWARLEFMNVNSPDYLHLQDEMRKYHVGGFGVTVFTDGATLLKSQPLEAAALTNGLQKSSKYPLLFAADFERGLSMRMGGTTGFPAAMAFGATGDTALATEFGRVSADEARAIGIQWNWFPVSDVNSNPANPIINTRSFSEDPSLVGDFVAAYIRGARAEGLLTTVKHFPGHGDTDTDSHLSLPQSNASLSRLDRVELVPFRAAIAAGVDSVMMAHITVPALEPDLNKPASISHNVVTGLLKDKLGFQGLVVTDALDMGGLMHSFIGSPAEISAQEAVAAILAGNDMVIIPADLDGAYNGLLNGVKSGKLTEQRIDDSVLKILYMKASVGLNRDRLVDVSAIESEVGKPENEAVAQRISNQAVTLVVDQNKLLPLSPVPSTSQSSPAAAPKVVAVFFTDDARTSEGAKAFARELHSRVPDASVLYVDQWNLGFVDSEVMAAVTSASAVIAVAEAVPTARRVTKGLKQGSSNIDQGAIELLKMIVARADDRTIVAAFGSPYVGFGISGIKSYICTFSNSPESAASLVGALFGSNAIHGRLPVSIPGIAKRGAGLDVSTSNGGQ